MKGDLRTEIPELSLSDSDITMLMETIPQSLIDAFVAVEDQRFWKHRGIDAKSLFRALVGFVMRDRRKGGGSTITQQLVRMAVLNGGGEQGFPLVKRKSREILLAARLEHEGDMSVEGRKKRILYAYLGRIYLGEHVCGVEKAASVFFDKKLSDLNLGECTLLASLPTRPAAYNPYTHPDNNQRKRRIVLRDMLDQGYISVDEYNEAIGTELYERLRGTYRFSPLNKERFIESVAGYVGAYSGRYGIKVQSPIIAQAILESEWGSSSLASKYNNYFGVKQGSSWIGETVSLFTLEKQISDETISPTTTMGSFRVYRNMEESVIDYFEVLSQPRYENLRGVTDPERYLSLLLRDGYSTDPVYARSNMGIIRQFDLERFDADTLSTVADADAC